MSVGPITHACRAFLSRYRLFPGHVSEALSIAARWNCSRAGRRLQLQGRSQDCLIEQDREDDDAHLELHPGSGNALLKVSRRRYLYREHGHGLADLELFDRQLPDVVCLGVQRDRYRLSQLVEHEPGYTPFYLRGDPPVRRVRSALRLDRPALVVTLVPSWSADHWDYNDGCTWRE